MKTTINLELTRYIVKLETRTYGALGVFAIDEFKVFAKSPYEAQEMAIRNAHRLGLETGRAMETIEVQS